MSRGHLPPGVQVRSAPTPADVQALRRAYLRRRMPQLRIVRLTSTLLLALALWFAYLSLRDPGRVVPWVVTGVCAGFGVAAKLLVGRIDRSVERHWSRPITTVFTDSAMYIDDEDDVWTIPYDAVRSLDRAGGCLVITDVEGGTTFLPLGAVPDAELGRFGG